MVSTLNARKAVGAWLGVEDRSPVLREDLIRFVDVDFPTADRGIMISWLPLVPWAPERASCPRDRVLLGS